MVIVVKGNRQDKRVNELIRWIEAKDFTVKSTRACRKPFWAWWGTRRRWILTHIHFSGGGNGKREYKSPTKKPTAKCTKKTPWWRWGAER